MKKLIVFLILLFATSGWSATYYSDYDTGNDANNGTAIETPWKYAPGMSGWTGSATFSNGDTIILKGGITWTYASTTASLWILSNELTIQGGQQLGSPWGTGYPILEGTGSTAERYGIYTSAPANTTLDGIEIYNTYYADVTGSGTGFNFAGDASGLEIKNCYFNTTGNQSILGLPGNGTDSILIHDNVMTNTNRLFIAVADNITVNDIQIYDNEFNGPGTFAGTAHGDGIMIGSACVDANDCLTNVKIYRNTFKGNWTHGASALVFLNNGTGSGGTQYGGNGVEVYNNQIAIETDGVISPGIIYIWSLWNNVKIYNNTADAYHAGSNPISSFLKIDHAATGVVVKNNIISGVTNGITVNVSMDTINELTADYNLYNTTDLTRYIYGWDGSMGPDCRSIAECISETGLETNGVEGDPVFVTDPTGSNEGDWNIQVTSDAIDAGLDLGATYEVDLNGATRTGSWDIGAYEYGDVTPPTAQTAIKDLGSAVILGANPIGDAFDATSQAILEREFAWMVGGGLYTQENVHPDNDTWDWTNADAMQTYCASNNIDLKIHSHIGPKCSEWAENDSRTANELETNLRAYMQAVAQRYNNSTVVKYMAVVNETIVDGAWHENKAGVGGYECPWYAIGQDTDDNSTPLYILDAFEVATTYATNLKLVYNHHEELDDQDALDSWTLIKETITYIRNAGYRVDAIGWQSHVDATWNTEANLGRLSDLIDWAHANSLEFHITEFSSWIPDTTSENLTAQAAHYQAVLELLSNKTSTGVVAWFTWHVYDGDTWHKEWYPAMWDVNGDPKPAYRGVIDGLGGMSSESMGIAITSGGLN